MKSDNPAVKEVKKGNRIMFGMIITTGIGTLCGKRRRKSAASESDI